MIIGKVIGNVVATIKHECLANKKLLLVRPVAPDGTLKKSGTVIAVDSVRAGKGDTVLLASEGRAATEIMGYHRRMPIRDIIVGIVERVDWQKIEVKVKSEAKKGNR